MAQRNVEIILIVSVLVQQPGRTAFVVFCGVLGSLNLNFKEHTDDDLRAMLNLNEAGSRLES